ncbi:MAG: D-alanyl-D-alanine carboxypeptidase [Lachnospiraceae bacterium]|nr:D-alanyl-D-alanine carboxypeptidase [Lachnospiraceae bacterium]
MERNVQTMRRLWARLCALALSLCLILGGCAPSQPGYETIPPSPSVWIPTEEETLPPGFAADLVVDLELPEEEPLPGPAAAAISYDITNARVLYSQSPYERLYPASVTKLFTVYTALRNGDITEKVTVGREAVMPSDSSICGVVPGDVISLEDLLYGALFPSGNDACAAIAVHISGSVAAFARLMNEEAAAIGATGSHFVNPHGLHDREHYTTAYDIYLVLRALAADDRFLQMFAAPQHTALYTSGGKQKSVTWSNTCRYLSGERPTPGDGELRVIAAKTGTTTPAGYCLATLAEDTDGTRYVTVILKAESRGLLYQDTDMMLRRALESR